MAVAIYITLILILLLGIALPLVRKIRYNPKLEYLELITPISADSHLEAIEMFYKVLHGMLRRNLKLWQPAKQVSLEIVSERSRGIRLIAVVPTEISAGFRSIINAHLPDVRIRRMRDYLHKVPDIKSVDSYHLKKSFEYTLSGSTKLDRTDPLSYSSSMLTGLKENEMVAIQIVISVASSHYIRRKKRRLIRRYRTLYDKGYVDLLSQTKYERALYKTQQPLFKVAVRSLVISDKKTAVKQRRLQINKGFSSLEGNYGQGLVLRKYGERNAYAKFESRYLPIKTNKHILLSRFELSLMFHFPDKTIRTENLSRSLSRTLPAPISLKNNREFDVFIGMNRHNGSETPIGLTEAERARHVYVIGGTGNGKTTMLLYSIIQDINSGKGVAVLDPHGDLAETVLELIPKSRIKDVIYFNPDDVAYPMGMNLLELPEGLNGEDLLREKDLVTESTISVMRKIFSEDDIGGHRIEYILRNAIQTALTLEKPTLFTIYSLLNDARFRYQIVNKLENKDLVNFWKNELGRAGEFQRVKMSAGITAKIGRFLFSASAKRVLEQEKSTINFEEIMNSGKILVCNFSKGLLGEDTSTLFGTIVLAKLQMASLRRARFKKTERRPFYLYVDEFQNFATTAFVQMLSEARKYGLSLTMAEQSTAQQSYQRLVDIILANVGTLICFRTGSPADEQLVLPLFKPFINEGEISNLASFQFYIRVAAVNSQEPFSGETILLGGKADVSVAKQIIKSSRYNYARRFVNKLESSPLDNVMQVR